MNAYPLQPLGEAVVGLVTADLLGELAGIGIGVDDEQLDPEHGRQIRQLLDTHGRGQHGVVRTAGGQPGLGGAEQVGAVGMPACVPKTFSAGGFLCYAAGPTV